MITSLWYLLSYEAEGLPVFSYEAEGLPVFPSSYFPPIIALCHFRGL